MLVAYSSDIGAGRGVERNGAYLDGERAACVAFPRYKYYLQGSYPVTAAFPCMAFPRPEKLTIESIPPANSAGWCGLDVSPSRVDADSQQKVACGINGHSSTRPPSSGVAEIV